MSAPRWARAVLRLVAPPERVDDLLGDLEEVHRRRARRRGRLIGGALTGLETLDVAATLARERLFRHRPAHGRSAPPSLHGGARRAMFSSLDWKLAFRMLAKYPGLTLIGSLAIAFAIGGGAVCFEVVGAIVHPALPLDDGDEIVGIEILDAEANRPERHVAHDVGVWRKELRSIRDLGAFRTVRRNLLTGDGYAAPAISAELSASAFRLARVPPLLGRPLAEADELPGAAPVVVIGFDLWRSRLGGDPDAVGRIVRLGDTPHTVVGVMPEGFAFPIAHKLWTPLQRDVFDSDRRQGPALRVFGRLAPGADLETAQAELAALGQRAATDSPHTHQHLRPRMGPYVRSLLGLSSTDSAVLLSVNLFVVMFLLLVCANVALLMFARAAAREREISVRHALGAGRYRIMGQLFAEAMALGGVALLVGLLAAAWVLRWGLETMKGSPGMQVPFWVDAHLAPTTVLYAGALTVLGALIAGGLPGLKVTGRRVEARLRQADGYSSALRFGGLWTVVIVVQVAVTVASPATSFFVLRDIVQIRSLEAGVPAHEYLSGRLGVDGPAALAELARRLAAEPTVAGVAFADRLPKMPHPQIWIETEAGGEASAASGRGRRVSVASVDPGYFDVLGARVLAGRGFHAADAVPGEGAVIVNRSFVDEVFQGKSAIGRRVRYANQERPATPRPAAGKPGPWQRIVGVVPDLAMTTGGDPTISGAGLYHPAEPGTTDPVYIAVHLKSDPAAFATRLRRLAAAVDPTLRIDQLMPLAEIHDTLLRDYGFWLRLTLVASALALVLSLAGIYSVMSFTVSRRTREIGIRMALGSDRWRILAVTFRRPLAQVGLGVIAGSGLVSLLAHAIIGGLSAREIAVVASYAMLMMVVCSLACIVPTRRALEVQPSESLRADT